MDKETAIEINTRRFKYICERCYEKDCCENCPEKNYYEFVDMALDCYDEAEWIRVPLKRFPEEYIDVCSECNTKALAEYKYCPNCGAKMKVQI